MKRLWVTLASLCLFLAIGCAKNYDARLDNTLANMQYQKKLNDALIPAVTTGKLKELDIYIRPPKALAGPTQTFLMAVIEPGKFDVENSFIEKEKQSLHILARVKRPKPPPKKGQAPTPVVTRGDFNTDVIDLIRNVYGTDVTISQFKDEAKKKNNYTFKHRTLSLDPKTIQVYLYGAKNNPYEVALIFEYQKTEHNAINPKIGYCLESFAVGERAKKAFSGATTEEELDEPEEKGSGPPI